ncbi:MAG: hypothetical protein HY403_01865 [Elusimicrobia bacterium]|nr:hypothetical protein [Elusimicrobiota bacterium]
MDEEVPPLSPWKVAIFVLALGLGACAVWSFWRTRAVAIVAAPKDYRKLFNARSMEREPPPKPVAAAVAPVSGIGMLRIDDDMRAPKPLAASEPPPAPSRVEAAPAAPAKPAKKTFGRPRLNSNAFSGLNGGAGIGYSGRTIGGGGSAPAAPDPAAPEKPAP